MIDSAVKENLILALPVLKEYWDEISPFMKVKNISAKTTLLNEGEIASNLFIVIDGCLRLFYLKRDGTEYTSQFFFERQFVTSLESFIEKKPSRQYIETLDQSKICVLSAKNIEKIIGMHEDFKKWYYNFLKERLIYYTRLHASFILDPPEERYLKLIEENPFILKRVPHYYIASYLGVTPVSLSRIRTRIKKRQINKG